MSLRKASRGAQSENVSLEELVAWSQQIDIYSINGDATSNTSNVEENGILPYKRNTSVSAQLTLIYL